MRRTLSVFLFMLVMLGSCRKELERPSWDVNLTGPLVYTSLGLDDLVADSLIQVNPDNSVTLVYDKRIYELDPDSLVDIPDTTLTNSFALPPFVPSISVVPNQQIFAQSDNNQFSVQDVELTEVILRNGICEVDITSTINQPTQYEYTLPNVKKDGIAFSVTITVPAGSIAVPVNYHTEFDLSNYVFDLRGTTGTSFNTFVSDIVIRMAPSSSPTTLTNSDYITISTGFTGMKPFYAKGYFGSQLIDMPSETADFSFFKKFISGTIDVAQVDVNLVLRNSIGADARITLNNLIAQNTRTGVSIPLTHSSIGNPININRATLSNFTPVASSYTIAMNNLNSNIDQILELLPDQFTAGMNMLLNPYGNVSAHNDFIFDYETFAADLQVTLPLNIIANNLTLSDTIDISVEKDQNGYVTDGIFKVYAENGFPLGGQLQMYLVDSNGNPADSIVAQGNLLPGNTNVSQVVTASSNSVLEFRLNKTQMEQLYNSTRIILQVKFSTSSLTQHVTIYDSYRLDLRMTGNFNYHIGIQ